MLRSLYCCHSCLYIESRGVFPVCLSVFLSDSFDPKVAPGVTLAFFQRFFVQLPRTIDPRTATSIGIADTQTGALHQLPPSRMSCGVRTTIWPATLFAGRFVSIFQPISNKKHLSSCKIKRVERCSVSLFTQKRCLLSPSGQNVKGRFSHALR